MERFKFDVSGQTFAINKECILEGPSSGLKKLCLVDSNDVIVVNRPPEVFGAILGMYQTGQLHIPVTSCPGAFLHELRYWDIAKDKLSKCCLFRLERFVKEQDTLNHFQQRMEALNNYSNCCSLFGCRALDKVRHRVWSIVDNRDKSLVSNIYFLLSILMVILSILCLALSTEPQFHRRMTNCERLQYMKSADMEDVDLVENILRSRCDSDDIPVNLTAGEIELNDESNSFYLDVEVYPTTVSTTTTTTTTIAPVDNITIEFKRVAPPLIIDALPQLKRIKIPNIRIPQKMLNMIEFITLIYFSMDLSLRLASCPSILTYFWSFVNITDALALLSSYFSLVLINLISPYYYGVTWMKIAQMFKISRSFRLFKVVVGFNVSKVLGFSLITNMKDILIMVVYLFAGMCFFSSFLYIVEDSDTIRSVPMGMYWAIITMTTVGYGDISPKTWAGRAIGCVCAISGVMVFALVVPLVVNHFITLYQYVGFDDKRVGEELDKINEKLVCDGKGHVNCVDGKPGSAKQELNMVSEQNKVSR